MNVEERTTQAVTVYSQQICSEINIELILKYFMPPI